MRDLHIFQQFAKKSKLSSHNKDGEGVIYTRVSTKEQLENNASLATQKKCCIAFANRKGIKVRAYFGGTYESAKSDERKEFQKMIAYVKSRKSISYIIVYSYDRFSRTGTNAAYISEQLKKQGILTLSATQEVNADTAAGSFQQNLYYLFSQFDNELRRGKSIDGMIDKLERGDWVTSIPLGYTNLNPGKGKTPKIVVNDDGKLLRQAFHWKANEDITYEEMAKRLKAKGLTIRSKLLSNIFRNPFYCGLMACSLIPGKVIKGNHEPLVSKELFLKVHGLLNGNTYGYSSDEQNLPLRQFVRSYECGTPYTGYVVRKKGLYYYKNNRKGSKENRSAKIMHKKFTELLSQYQLSNKGSALALREMMLYTFTKHHEEALQQNKIFKKKIEVLDSKLERLEERFVFDEITREQYNKFSSKIITEKYEIEEQQISEGIDLSNLDKAIDKALQYSLKLPDLWVSGDLGIKRSLQNMVFPEGVLFDFKNDCYRTTRVNSIFDAIPYFSVSYSQKQKRTNQHNVSLSSMVAPWRIELPTL
ncbi:recombinase family protein [Fulvivirga sp. 29W222]|uniref:Recombinase family protein n=1 Tax=Fulvivirga marina TaxID=2494733 RepID=A0A937KD74_9BACT|nr:recombinase family protein [Fulvivirga marina]MBL6445745.1 recombinase family protein [Fulvivirga marina]